VLQFFAELPEHNSLVQEHPRTSPQLLELLKVLQTLGKPEHELVNQEEVSEQPAFLHKYGSES